ncbi:hypothetical protein D3C78_1971930 [compost metagenome]
MFNRQLPIVINKQPGVVPFTERNGGGNILFDLLIRQILDAQLDRGNTRIQQASNPFDTVDYRG